MRLDVSLHELLDKPIEWDWGYWVLSGATAEIQAQPAPKDYTRTAYSASFSVPTGSETHHYEMEFHKVLDRWRVDFALVKGSTKIRKLQQFDDAKTGLKVMGTIMDILYTFLQQTKFPPIMFSAMKSEPSRVRLYDRLSAQVSAKHHYKLEREVNDKEVLYFLLHGAEKQEESLTESFDNPFHWSWVARGPQVYTAKFKAGDTMITVDIERNSRGPVKDGLWDVTFSVQDEGKVSFKLQNWGDQSMSQRILATVVEVMATFTQTTREPIRELWFSAFERSRVKLYTRMIQRLLATKAPDYTVRVRVDRFTGTLFSLINTKFSDDQQDNRGTVTP